MEAGRAQTISKSLVLEAARDHICSVPPVWRLAVLNSAVDFLFWRLPVLKSAVNLLFLEAVSAHSCETLV
jgi:hypothetical protein